jgi:hypothetical protein
LQDGLYENEPAVWSSNQADVAAGMVELRMVISFSILILP